MIDFSEGEYYHVFNRGVEKRIIFNDDIDHRRFQTLLFLCNVANPVHYTLIRDLVGHGTAMYKFNRGTPLVHIGAYCLLRNHFHILLKEYRAKGISQFMQKLSTAYTMYFNIRSERKGVLFQGKFRAKHASHDDYLKYLYSYIHLNPAQHIEVEWKKSGAKNTDAIWSYIAAYRFSSLIDYMGMQRSESAILAPKEFPEYFRDDQSVRKEIFSWLKLKPYGMIEEML